MYKEVLRAIAGIDIFPAISLVVFVITFLAGVVRAVRMDHASVQRLAALPLDEPGSGVPGRCVSSLTEGVSRGA
ncbi:MAG TPA: hypothetical protein VGD94_01270 [Vicinamibacterales bacterium]